MNVSMNDVCMYACTCLSFSLPTYVSIFLPTYLPIYLSICLPACLPTYLYIYLCMHLSIYLSTYLSFCLPIYPSFYLSFFLSIGFSVFLSICLSFFLPVFLSIYLSIYRSIDLSIYQSIYLPVYTSIHLLSIFPSIHLSTYPPIYLSVCLSIYLSFYLSIYPPIHLSIHLSVYLSVCLCVCLPFYPSDPCTKHLCKEVENSQWKLELYKQWDPSYPSPWADPWQQQNRSRTSATVFHQSFARWCGTIHKSKTGFWTEPSCCFLNRILNIAFLLFLEIQGWKHGCDHGCWPGNGFSTNHVSMKSPNHGILGLNLWTIVIIFLSQRQGFAALSVCDFSIHQPHSKNCSALPRLGFFALLPWNWGLLFLISMVNRWITWLQDFRGSIYKLYIYIYVYIYIFIYVYYI